MPTLLPVPKARLVVPIRRSQQSLGAVVVEREQDPAWGRETLQPLVSLADHAAVAVENVRLFAQIQREKDRANQIISSMTDGLLTLDQNARVISINPAAEALTGWRTEEAVGHLLCEVLGCLTGEPRDEACSLVRAVRERSSIHSEKRNIRHRLGFDCVLSISVAHLPALGEHAGGSVVLLHDITEEEALERFQRELIASFSHELRTPLTSITTIAEMLAIDEDVKGDSSRREQLEMLQQQSQRLASFAQRILELSLLESGQWILELRPLPLAHLVSGVVRQWQSSWPGRRFSLQVPDGHLWAWADEQALQTVVNCLVDNAVKYAPADTPVELSVEIGPAGYAEIGVQDHGPGISPQHQERIFQRFYRVDGGDAQRVYGYGLGLHIAKHLATAMGGQISVSSTPETGSRFTVLLPITGERA
jgi:PAS domain S-box-containing protein